MCVWILAILCLTDLYMAEFLFFWRRKNEAFDRKVNSTKILVFLAASLLTCNDLGSCFSTAAEKAWVRIPFALGFFALFFLNLSAASP